MFVPWAEDCFVTGGSDHAVIMWNEMDVENCWKPTALHRSMHSSAVMGVAGMQQKKVVLSAGADKRIFGYDVNSGRTSYRHLMESKCMNIQPNPCDFNLFMVQTGWATPTNICFLLLFRDADCDGTSLYKSSFFAGNLRDNFDCLTFEKSQGKFMHLVGNRKVVSLSQHWSISHGRLTGCWYHPVRLIL